ncbi:MAG: HDOD domain-containing protein [Thiobacillus sp.]
MTQVEQLKISGQLPTPRGVALAILELTQRENVSLGEVARVVQTDPALSGRLIKLANSASQLPRPVASVQEAVVRQGMSVVSQLALGFSLVDQYREGNCRAFDYPHYWSHSLLMALSMQALATHVMVGAPDEMFSCGLFAQIGTLALATAYPEAYSTILDTHQSNPAQPLHELEQQHLETNHLELCELLLTEWGLPKFFIEPVAHYHNPSHTEFTGQARAQKLVTMLQLAHQLADLGLATNEKQTGYALAWRTQTSILGLSEDETARLADTVMQRWKEWGALLNITSAVVPPFADICNAEAKSQSAPLRIVVVDSNVFSRRKLLGWLEGDTSHQLYVAEDGRQALAIVVEVMPHVIITQAELPQMSGIELCRALRATAEGQRIHIMIATPDDLPATQTQAMEAGADGCLSPNADQAGLYARLQAAYRQMRLQTDWEQDRLAFRNTTADLAVQNRQLANAALTDPLTGLPNRRAAMEHLAQAWSAAARNQHALSVMMIDIDHFKRINDAHGHAAGDDILRKTAATLRTAMRREDTVCRIGGEEFLVICEQVDLDAARQSAERIREALSAQAISVTPTEPGLTVSLGVANRDSTMPDADALVRAADQALYRAKTLGRNRVCEPLSLE